MASVHVVSRSATTSRRHSGPSSKGIWKSSMRTARTLSDGRVVGWRETWIMGVIIMERGPNLALAISAGAFDKIIPYFGVG